MRGGTREKHEGAGLSYEKEAREDALVRRTDWYGAKYFIALLELGAVGVHDYARNIKLVRLGAARDKAGDNLDRLVSTARIR